MKEKHQLDLWIRDTTHKFEQVVLCFVGDSDKIFSGIDTSFPNLKLIPCGENLNEGDTLSEEVLDGCLRLAEDSLDTDWSFFLELDEYVTDTPRLGGTNSALRADSHLFVMDLYHELHGYSNVEIETKTGKKTFGFLRYPRLAPSGTHITHDGFKDCLVSPHASVKIWSTAILQNNILNVPPKITAYREVPMNEIPGILRENRERFESLQRGAGTLYPGD